MASNTPHSTQLIKCLRLLHNQYTYQYIILQICQTRLHYMDKQIYVAASATMTRTRIYLAKAALDKLYQGSTLPKLPLESYTKDLPCQSCPWKVIPSIYLAKAALDKLHEGSTLPKLPLTSYMKDLPCQSCP